MRVLDCFSGNIERQVKRRDHHKPFESSCITVKKYSVVCIMLINLLKPIVSHCVDTHKPHLIKDKVMW